MEKKLYLQMDSSPVTQCESTEDFCRLYFAHLEAMRNEGLSAQTDIAAELAYRDLKIEKLRAAFENLLSSIEYDSDVLPWLIAEGRKAIATSEE